MAARQRAPFREGGAKVLATRALDFLCCTAVSENLAPPTGSGPIDGNRWPAQLTARVVDPGPPARIHGANAGEPPALPKASYSFSNRSRSRVWE